MAENSSKASENQRHRARLAKVGVLLVDNDSKILDLLSNVLKTLGFGQVITARDGFEGLKAIENTPIDLVVTDWELKPMTELGAQDVEPNPVITTDWELTPPIDGASFVRYLRSAPSSPNRYLPIIMLTGPTLADNVRYARDSGVSEILKKPVTAKLLCDRIVTCIEDPRSFITASSYKGPDRRRRNVPFDEDRRKIDIRVIKHSG